MCYYQSKNNDQWTPLRYASYNGKTDVVKYLASKGANKNAKDDWNDTPYDYANNDEIRKLLKWKKNISLRRNNQKNKRQRLKMEKRHMILHVICHC